jgi:hypothetical protein
MEHRGIGSSHASDLPCQPAAPAPLLQRCAHSWRAAQRQQVRPISGQQQRAPPERVQRHSHPLRLIQQQLRGVVCCHAQAAHLRRQTGALLQWSSEAMRAARMGVGDAAASRKQRAAWSPTRTSSCSGTPAACPLCSSSTATTYRYTSDRV